MWPVFPDLHSLGSIVLLFYEGTDLEGRYMSCACRSVWHRRGFRTNFSCMFQGQPINSIKTGLINSHCGHTERSMADNDPRQVVCKYLPKNPQTLDWTLPFPRPWAKDPLLMYRTGGLIPQGSVLQHAPTEAQDAITLGAKCLVPLQTDVEGTW